MCPIPCPNVLIFIMFLKYILLVSFIICTCILYTVKLYKEENIDDNVEVSSKRQTIVGSSCRFVMIFDICYVSLENDLLYYYYFFHFRPSVLWCRTNHYDIHAMLGQAPLLWCSALQTGYILGSCAPVHFTNIITTKVTRISI